MVTHFHLMYTWAVLLERPLTSQNADFRGPVKFHVHKLLEITLKGKYVPAPVIFSANDFTVWGEIEHQIYHCPAGVSVDVLGFARSYGLDCHAAINADINTFACVYNLLGIII